MNGEATRELTRAASTHGGGVSLRETAVLLEDATRCVCGAHAELCWRPPSHLLALSPHVIAGLPYYHVPRVRPPMLEPNEPSAAGGKNRKICAGFVWADFSHRAMYRLATEVQRSGRYLGTRIAGAQIPRCAVE